MSKFVLDLDVGYSNLVIAYVYFDGEPPLKVMKIPSPSVPISKLPAALTARSSC